MIKGLNVTIVGAELCKLCEQQVKHHQERATFYKQKADELEAGGAESNNYTGGDPVKSLRDSEERHSQSATEMQFVADHLVADEDYLLDRSDLQRIGVVKSRF